MRRCPMELNVDKLEAHRNVLNENPRQFAIRLGVSHAWYYKVLNGEMKNPQIETLNKVSDALGIPAKDLIR